MWIFRLLNRRSKSRRSPGLGEQYCGAPVYSGTCQIRVSDGFVCFYHPNYDPEAEENETNELVSRLEARSLSSRWREAGVSKREGFQFRSPSELE